MYVIVLGTCSFYSKCAARYLPVSINTSTNIREGLEWLLLTSRNPVFFEKYVEAEVPCKYGSPECEQVTNGVLLKRWMEENKKGWSDELEKQKQAVNQESDAEGEELEQ
jgi:hypothetical protein